MQGFLPGAPFGVAPVSSEEVVVEKYSLLRVVNEHWRKNDGEKILEDASEQEFLSPPISGRNERFDFWCSVCQNAAASEIAVNFALPWFLCDVHGGVIQPPELWWLNMWVLFLNLWSSYMEGYTKSARLLTQTRRKIDLKHYTVFIAANGFCYGFLNVSSSFPDVGSGGSDIAIATGSVMAGAIFVIMNMVGSIFFYRWGRNAGWRDMQKIFKVILRLSQLLPVLMNVVLLAGFIFAITGPEQFGTDFPLDFGDPDVVGGLENVQHFLGRHAIYVKPGLIGLAFGVLMSTLGVIFATMLVELWFHDRDRPLARLIGNFTSTVLVLLLAQIQDHETSPNFFLMKFNSSFCTGLSAFTGTMGEVFDQCFGTAKEELFDDQPDSDEKCRRHVWWWPDLTGIQNFVLHWIQTMAIMMFCMRFGPDDQDPLPPIVVSESSRLSFVRESSALSNTMSMWHIGEA